MRKQDKQLLIERAKVKLAQDIIGVDNFVEHQFTELEFDRAVDRYVKWLYDQVQVSKRERLKYLSPGCDWEDIGFNLLVGFAIGVCALAFVFLLTVLLQSFGIIPEYLPMD